MYLIFANFASSKKNEIKYPQKSNLQQHFVVLILT